jgi:hypothetical protein
MSGRTDYSGDFFFVLKQKSDPLEIREHFNLRSYEPFYASIEVKTEREGLGTDAIRQPITDNPDEFPDGTEQYRVVVGQEPSRCAEHVASD